MAEYTSRELIDAIYDVRDRVTRIEEQLIRSTEHIKERANEAYRKADAVDNLVSAQAQKIESLEKRIDALVIGMRWAWGIAIPALLAVTGMVINILSK